MSMMRHFFKLMGLPAQMLVLAIGQGSKYDALFCDTHTTLCEKIISLAVVLPFLSTIYRWKVLSCWFRICSGIMRLENVFMVKINDFPPKMGVFRESMEIKSTGTLQKWAIFSPKLAFNQNFFAQSTIIVLLVCTYSPKSP